MFGSGDFRGGGNNRSRDRSSSSHFGGGGGRGTSSSRDQRRPPYASQRDGSHEGGNRGFGGGRATSRRHDDRRGGPSGRYRGGGGGGSDRGWREHDDRGGYRGGKSGGSKPGGGGSFYSNGRGGGGGSGGNFSRQQGGRGSDSHYSRGRWGGGRGPSRGFDNRDNSRWEKNRSHQNGRSEQSWDMPEGLQWMVNIKGHGKKITSIAFDEGSGKLFTASEDTTMRVWSAETGQCEHTVNYDGEVQTLLLASGYLFVGVHNFSPSSDRMNGELFVYNLTKNTEERLPAHAGRIACLHVVNDFLFSGGEDKQIKAWKFNTTTEFFDAAGSLGPEQGGHPSSVQCLASLSNLLFSGDRAGNIRVWNLDTGKLAQKLDKAHHRSIMSMVIWQEYLITGSLDGNLYVWKYNKSASGGLGLALDVEPFYRHRGKTNNGPAPGVLSCCGTLDGEGNSILMVGVTSCEVLLYSLPEFEVKGSLPEIEEARALAFASGGYVFVGDMRGEIKVFSWGGVAPDHQDLLMEA